MEAKEFITCRSSHTRGLVSGFEQSFVAISADINASAKSIVHHRGIASLLRLILRDDDAELNELAERNLRRRQIRFPAFFANALITWVYRKVTRIQCRLLFSAFELGLEPNPQANVLIYNGYLMPDSVLATAAARHQRPTAFLERGFFPNTVQCDRLGINYLSSLPQDPRFYQTLDPERLGAKPTTLVKRQSKLKPAEMTPLPARYIFVPFQVPSDMQILALSPWIRDMEQFYEVIADLAGNNETLEFVIKEHPSFPLSIREKVKLHNRVHFANHHDTQALIEDADAVITVNSTVGLEALLLEKKVVTLGFAPYAIPGIVLTAANSAELQTAVVTLPSWQPDESLRDRVLRYVYNIFLLHGELKNPAAALPSLIRARINGSDEHGQSLAAFAAANRGS
jgi:capsular polysaccharide export protein